MALNPADIAVVSQLLDQALALPAEEREAWLSALPAEHQRHLDTLRGMLAHEVELDIDSRLDALPRLPVDESMAHGGDLVGPYRLIREIGRGGMGSVWLAERADGAYKRNVALKLPRLVWGAGVAGRMAREREIGMLLEHPNIARLYDAGVDERGRPYLALEYIDGQPIDAWCEAQRLSVRDRLRLVVQVARAVAYAHGRLVVHRDLKPSNVLVTPDGQVHLLDFGIAKLLDEALPGDAGLTQLQGRVLTPYYASPEQVAGDTITVQSDVYSLGVLLYELLTGTLPIVPVRRTLGAVEEAILQGDAPPASSRVNDKATARALRGEVDAILAKSMRRDPLHRYASAESLSQDIERHLRGETVAARPDTLAYRVRKALRRHALAVSAASGVALAMLGGGTVALVQARRAAEAAERAGVVKDFVTEVFRINTRANDDGLRQQPAEQLLAHGAQLIDSRFPRQPVLRAELLGVVGGIYAQMGAHGLAADFMQRQLSVLDALRPDGAERVHVMLNLAEALLNGRNTAAALKIVGDALHLAEGDELLRYDGLVMLLRCQTRAGSRNLASATLQQVQALEQRLDVRNRIASAWALHAGARVQADNNQGEAAFGVYDRAIEAALRIEGPRSLAAAEMRLEAAGALMSLNRWDAADTRFDAAVSVLRSSGQAGEARAILAMINRDFMLGQYGRQSAVAASGSIAQHIAALQRWQAVVPADMFARSELSKAWMDLQGGNLVPVQARLDGIGKVVKLEANPRMLSEWTLLGSAAAAMAGDTEIADTLGRQALTLRLRTGAGGAQFTILDHLQLVYNMIRAGRAADAEAYLDAMPAIAPVKGDPVAGDYYVNLPKNARALSRLARGDAAGARRVFGVEVDALDDDDDGSMFTEWNPNVIRAWLWCESDQPVRGLKALAQAEAARARYAFAQDPGLAWLRGREGLCAWRLGKHAEAKRLAALAREAFNRQPGVSQFYKAPLFELERALGLRAPPI